MQGRPLTVLKCTYTHGKTNRKGAFRAPYYNANGLDLKI